MHDRSIYIYPSPLSLSEELDKVPEDSTSPINLHLKNKSLLQTDIEALERFMTKHGNVCTLELTDNDIEDYSRLSDAITIQDHQPRVYFTYSARIFSLESKSGKELISFLQNKALYSLQLNLGANPLTSSVLKQMIIALKQHPPLRRINLQECILKTDDIELISSFIEILCHAQEITLDLPRLNTFERHAIIMMLANILSANPPLKELNLGRNNLSDHEIVAIAHALENNTNLDALFLYDNNWDKEKRFVKGSKAFAECLRKNSTLSCLHFGGDNLPSEGIHELFQSLRVNRSLQLLSLSGHMLDAKLQEELNQVLDVNSTLISISSDVDVSPAIKQKLKNNAFPKSSDTKGTEKLSVTTSSKTTTVSSRFSFTAANSSNSKISNEDISSNHQHSLGSDEKYYNKPR